jgi:DNA polymerase-1
MRLTTSRIACVGEVTAKKFLKEYGSMENLLANTDKLKGKMKENIEANKEKGILSKTLATICSTAPLFLTKRIMNYLLQMSKNRCSFNELEFRRMAEQFDSIFKKEGTTTASNLMMMTTHPKVQKKAKINLIF